MIAVNDVSLTVHEDPHGKFRGAFVPTGHPMHHWKVGLDNLLSLFEAFCRFISVFRYAGEEVLHSHKVPFVAALLTHVIVFLLEPSLQVILMIRSIDGFQQGIGKWLFGNSEHPGNPVHAGASSV